MTEPEAIDWIFHEPGQGAGHRLQPRSHHKPHCETTEEER